MVANSSVCQRVAMAHTESATVVGSFGAMPVGYCTLRDQVGSLAGGSGSNRSVMRLLFRNREFQLGMGFRQIRRADVVARPYREIGDALVAQSQRSVTDEISVSLVCIDVNN